MHVNEISIMHIACTYNSYLITIINESPLWISVNTIISYILYPGCYLVAILILGYAFRQFRGQDDLGSYGWVHEVEGWWNVDGNLWDVSTST